MSFKPSDFFLGIFDLFGILMPGALLLLWVKPNIYTSLSNLVSAQFSDTPAKWLVFFFAAYLVGHIISTCGGFLGAFVAPFADLCIDWFHAKNAACADENPGSVVDINSVKVLREKAEEVFEQMGWREKTHQRKIIMAYVYTKNNTAASEIERLRTVARFFRSLTLVFLIISFSGIAIYKAECIFLALFTLWLYLYSHRKQRETTYVYFISQCLADGKL